MIGVHKLILLLWLSGAVLPISAKDEAAEADPLNLAFDQGMAAFAKSDWTVAISELEKVLALVDALPDPAMKIEATKKLAPVLFTLGAAAFNLPDYEKCIVAFERFEKNFPSHEKVPEVRRALGRAAFANKDFEKALLLFAEMEKYPSQRDQALQIQAECHREMGNTEGMEIVLSRLIEGGIKTTSQADAGLQLAMAKLETQKFEELPLLVEQLIARRNLVRNVVALNHLVVSLGDAQAKQEKFEEASRTYLQALPPEQVIAFQKDRIALLERRIAANEVAAAANPQGALAIQAQNGELKPLLEESKKLLGEFEALPDYMPGLMLRSGRCWYGREKKWEFILVNERLLERYPSAGTEREAALFGCIVGYAEVKEVKTCQDLCKTYLTTHPEGPNADTVAYIQGAVAMESGDLKGAASLFGKYIKDYPEGHFTEQTYLVLGNVFFNLGEMDDARRIYLQYVDKFPKGPSIEEAKYRAAIIPVFQGKYEEGWKEIEAFIKKVPQSEFTPDAKYRLMVCKYAASLFDEIIEDAGKWQKAHGGLPMEAEVLALKGDCLAALTKNAEAAEAYIASTKANAPDEVLGYSLNEASKLLQKLGDMARLSQIWEDFIKTKPDDPNVVTGIYWIGRAKTHEGKVDEAKGITVDHLKLCLNQQKNESVEMLLTQLAQFCWKRPRTKAKPVEADPSPEAPSPPPWDAVGELEKHLAALDAIAEGPGVARLIYARIELLKLLKKPEEVEALMHRISVMDPEVLSPQLLGLAGEFLQSKTFDDQATVFFHYLKDNYPKSAWLDYAYCGLGATALKKGDAAEALRLYTLAADEYTGARAKESTMGKGLALMELGKFAEAKPIFEQVAGAREWRGEITAQAVYSLGELEQRQDRLPEAIAHYQRVFAAYQKYILWMEKAYFKAAECFDKLGKRPEAIAHLQEVLRQEKLGPKVKGEARRQLEQWGVKG